MFNSPPLNTSDAVDANDFWQKWSDAYNILSSVSNYDDWQTILSTIAFQLMRSAVATPSIDVLDVGAGIGNNSFAIMNQLYSHYNLLSRWHLVEPDQTVHPVARAIFPCTNPLMGLVDIHARIPQERVNSILFLHSSYYISNFTSVLCRLVDRQLKQNGNVVVCALPSYSPFFLGMGELVLPNTADAIVGGCELASLPYTCYHLHSRIRFPGAFLEDERIIALLWDFFTGRRIAIDPFKRRFRAIFSNEVDLADQIISIG